MNSVRFKYRSDRRCRIITWSVLGCILLAGVLLRVYSPGEYLPVWFASIALATVALTLLSVPRSIRITPDAVEIRCTVEITHISYHHIRSVRRIDRSELRPLVPVFASPGFFGYFGYWLDVRNWDFIKVYATAWQGLVVIEDIYEQRYVVCADDPDMLCKAIVSRMKEAEKPGVQSAQTGGSSPEVVTKETGGRKTGHQTTRKKRKD